MQKFLNFLFLFCVYSASVRLNVANFWFPLVVVVVMMMMMIVVLNMKINAS